MAIKFGGDFVVDGASAIAVKAGLSQNLIGLTIVAMGTSLPEFEMCIRDSLPSDAKTHGADRKNGGQYYPGG